MPTAVITDGTIIGDSSTPRISGLNGSRPRLSPSAAKVPRMVARVVAVVPISRLLRSEGSQRSEVSTDAYQRVDRPGSGNISIELELNDSGMIVRIGATRNSNTTPQNTRNPNTPRRWLRKASYGDLFMT